MSRIGRRQLAAWGALWLLCLNGCLSTLFRGGEKTADVPVEEEEEDKPLRLVGDVARPFGLEQYVATHVALVTGLDNTGSDPPPSPERDLLLSDMRIRQVDSPAKVLASPDTSLVMVRGVIPPAAREGDRFDVEVLVPRRSETTSLRGGWLMLTPIKPMAILQGDLHTGTSLGYAEGAIIDQAALEGSEDVALQKRGWILGGGKVSDNRTLGLLMGQDEHWFRLVKEVTHAINSRFYTYDRGQKVGVAEAKRDTFIELQLPRRYRHNLTRYMKVTLNIPYRFETISRMDYVRQTGRELLDLETSEDASVRLEGIGNDSVPMLLEGLQHDDATVRFYAAETLAYLNRGDGLKVLATMAEQEAALRLRAITALSAVDDMHAHEALTKLLDSESAETRYGAFRALHELNPHDPTLGKNKNTINFNFYRIVTGKSPMIHISRSGRPEIVLFGGNQQFASTPFVVFAGKQLVIKSDVPGHLAIKRFSRDGSEETRDVGTSVSDVVEALGEINASYPQVVQVLQEAKRQGVLPSRIVFDALPRSGRDYSPGDLDLPQERDEPDELKGS